MRRVLFLTIINLLTLCAYSQEHIKFNGATFGKPLKEFVKEMGNPKPAIVISSPTNFSDKCNEYVYSIVLNKSSWNCFVLCTRKTNTVFRTMSYKGVDNGLKNYLMSIVKVLEEKYGNGLIEKQENLGKIGERKEMLALYYFITNSKKEKIGEIRISIAPNKNNIDSGTVELTYTDYKSQKLASTEYESIMRDSF